MTDLPPFKAGQQAQREGKPCEPPEMPEGDLYPGARQMWVDGWNVAHRMSEHLEQMRRRVKALGILSDGRPRTKSELFRLCGEIEREQWRRMIIHGHVKAERVSAGGNDKVWIYSVNEAARENQQENASRY